jgi:hypothetical protein
MTLRTITTVFAPASASPPAGAYDLTTLALAHSELQIPVNDTSQDSWLSMAITQVSGTVANYCNRVFQIEGLTDLIYVRREGMPPREPTGAAPLILSRWPIAQVTSIETSADTPSGGVLPLASAPPSWVVEGVPVSGLNITPGDTVASLAGDNVTLESGTILGDIPEGTPITFGLSVVQTFSDGTQNGLVLGTDFTGDFTSPANPAASNPGELFRLDLYGRLASWEAVPTNVSYFAGYATLPPDVVDATLRLLTARKYMRGTNPFIKETDHPAGGRTVYWVGGPPVSGSVPQEIAGILDKYRVPVAL